MEHDFLHTTLGNTGLEVFRLGLSASYWPGKKAVYTAFDAGVNLFFGYGFDGQMIKTMRDIFKFQRDKCVLVTGAYNLLYGHPNLRRTVEKRLRQFRTDYVDVFLFLGVMKEKHMKEHVFEEMYRLREEGKVKAVGLSTHNRKLAGRLAAEGKVDALMIRYNAAHPGAEEDIFPYLDAHDPGVISYTATRWSYLLKHPKKHWPSEGRIPTAGECYRFVLSNPNVDVCLTAPRNVKQLLENLEAVKMGPLSEQDMMFMRSFGEAVHHSKKWFM